MGASYFVLDLRDNLGGLVQVSYLHNLMVDYNLSFILEVLCLSFLSEIMEIEKKPHGLSMSSKA